MDNIIKNYVDDVIIKQKQIPYIDILVKKGYDTKYRYFQNANGTANGKEKLYMYSCSKVITAVATMMLVEKDVIKLEDEVSKYIPNFSNSYIIENGTEVKSEPITIKHLLSMSSGLDYNFNSKYIKERFSRIPSPTAKDIASEIIKSPLNFQPGSMFKYGLSHDVLGGVIEVVTGERFSTYIKKEIFEPLNMINSTFTLVDDYDFEPLYFSSNGKILPFNYEQEKWANHPTYDGGGGGLKSTVLDYSLFLEVLANGGVTKGGYQLIKPETLKLMTEETTKNLKIENNYTCVQGKDYGYGLGVRVRKIDTPWGLEKGEFGWDGAAGSYAMVDTKNKVSITIGMHVRNWPEVFRGEHLKLVEMIYKNIL